MFSIIRYAKNLFLHGENCVFSFPELTDMLFFQDNREILCSSGKVLIDVGYENLKLFFLLLFLKVSSTQNEEVQPSQTSKPGGS